MMSFFCFLYVRLLFATSVLGYFIGAIIHQLKLCAYLVIITLYFSYSSLIVFLAIIYAICKILLTGLKNLPTGLKNLPTGLTLLLKTTFTFFHTIFLIYHTSFIIFERKKTDEYIKEISNNSLNYKSLSSKIKLQLLKKCSEPVNGETIAATAIKNNQQPGSTHESLKENVSSDVSSVKASINRIKNMFKDEFEKDQQKIKMILRLI